MKVSLLESNLILIFDILLPKHALYPIQERNWEVLFSSTFTYKCTLARNLTGLPWLGPIYNYIHLMSQQFTGLDFNVRSSIIEFLDSFIIFLYTPYPSHFLKAPPSIYCHVRAFLKFPSRIIISFLYTLFYFFINTLVVEPIHLRCS